MDKDLFHRYEMIRVKAKEHIHELHTFDRYGRGIVCPLCGNGSGKDGDGVTFIKRSRGYDFESGETHILHCFKCGFSGDLIKLQAAEMNCSYNEAAKILAEKLGMYFDFDESIREKNPPKKFEAPKKLPVRVDKPATIDRVDYSEFFIEANKNLEKTDYFTRRGLSLRSCRYFRLGFVFAWNHPKVANAPKSPRLIIPTSKFSYLARDVRDKIPDYQKKYSKQKVGSVSLFNTQAFSFGYPIVFVVEGEIDAISFFEVGYPAVALGTTSNTGKLIKYLQSSVAAPKCVVLALDNDEGGKAATQRIQKDLKKIGVLSMTADDIYGKYKDANEALVADREIFKQKIKTVFEKAEKFIQAQPASPKNKHPRPTEEELRARKANMTIEEYRIREATKRNMSYEEYMAARIGVPTEEFQKTDVAPAEDVDSIIFISEKSYQKIFDYGRKFQERKDASGFLLEHYLGDLLNLEAEKLVIELADDAAKNNLNYAEIIKRFISQKTFFIQREDGKFCYLVNGKLELINFPVKDQTLETLDENFDDKTVDVAEKIALEPEQVAEHHADEQNADNVVDKNDESKIGNGFIKTVSEDHCKEEIKRLNEITEYTNDTVLIDEVLRAAAACRVYKPDVYANFRALCKKGTVNLKLFEEKINDLIKPIKKEKRREEKEQEYRRAYEIAMRRRKELEEKKSIAIETIKKLYAQPFGTERNEKIINTIFRILDRSVGGTAKGSARNFDLILNYDPYIRGCIGYDKSSSRMVARKILPWRDPHDKRTGKTDAWNNSDDNSLWCYMSRTYEIENFKNMVRAVDDYAKLHSFNPIQEYLESLPKWDGTPRADSFFINVLGVKDSKYARLVTRHWLLAAVARIFNPGCKWDYALIIKGDQGIGKSTAFAKLGGKWFNDSIDSINGKDAIEQLLGSWIVELGEMQATKKSTNEAIKSFLSRRVDKIRLPYLQRSEEYPRQAVFAGTTNNEEFLKDLTGSRRFLVLVALASDAEAKQKLAAIDKNYINQLWAEVLVLYKELFKDGFDSFKLIPPNEVFEIAKQLHKNYTEGSEVEGLIRSYLDIPIFKQKLWRNMTQSECREYIQKAKPNEELIEGKTIRMSVSAIEIANELFKVDNPNRERALLRQINEILAHIEGWRRVTWKRCGVYGQQRIAFERNVEELKKFDFSRAV